MLRLFRYAVIGLGLLLLPTASDAIPICHDNCATVETAVAPGKTAPRFSFANLPLDFELNRGQAPVAVKFLTRGAGDTFFFTPSETVLTLVTRGRADHTASSSTLRLRFLGGNRHPLVEGLDPLPAKSNYLLGNDPARWIHHVPHYAKLTYHDVYPGIDQVFYGSAGTLEYDLIVQPSANPTIIRLGIDGASALRLSPGGDARLRTPSGTVIYKKPVAYQEIDGERHAVESHYVRRGDNELRIAIGEYRHDRPLVIDPTLVYSTYLGGEGGYQGGVAIAVGADGSAYVAGWASTVNFPIVNPLPGGASRPTNLRYPFVVKFAPDGQSLLYATYFGGSQYDQVSGLAVDGAGSAVLVGNTSSSDFPTANALQTTLRGTTNAFVTKLTPAGDALVYSTYLGGSGGDSATGVALDLAGNAYVGGTTSSSDFPLANPYQAALLANATQGGFVTKMSPQGAMIYSTYLGGGSCNQGQPYCDSLAWIAVDSAGSAYVAGNTTNASFPTQSPITGQSCPGLFVTKFDPSGATLAYSTCISDRSGLDVSSGIAVDSAGSAYLLANAIATASTLPTVNAYQAANHAVSGTNAYVAKLTPAGDALVYATYLGGSGPYDSASGIAVDAKGHAYVSGTAGSSDFPLLNAMSYRPPGPTTPFLTEFDPSGAALVYSTLVGGGGNTQALALALDAQGDAYLTGVTDDRAFFPVVNALKGAWDQPATSVAPAPLAAPTSPITPHIALVSTQAFMLKVIPAILSPTATALSATATQVVNGSPVTFTATVAGSNPAGSASFYDTRVDANSATHYDFLGRVMLSGATASLTTAALASSAIHSVHAVYNGDANNAWSASNTVGVQTVAFTTTVLTASESSLPSGQPLTLRAQVNGGTPSGSVSFFDGSTVLGTVALVNGTASLTTSTLNTGVDVLTARYSGDAFNLPSTSAPVAVTALIVFKDLTDGMTVSGNTLAVNGGPLVVPPGTTIAINGIAGTINPDGSFVVANVPLTLGANTLTITLTFPDGSSYSQTSNVVSTPAGKPVLATSWSIVDLRTLGNFPTSNANGITVNGKVSGYSESQDGNKRFGFWYDGLALHQLNPLPSGSFSDARAITLNTAVNPSPAPAGSGRLGLHGQRPGSFPPTHVPRHPMGYRSRYPYRDRP